LKFHKDEYDKLASAGYVASDPKNIQEVFSNGDHVSDNSLEPGKWSLKNDTFFDKNISTGISLGKEKIARCNLATNCAVCKLVKAPQPVRFPMKNPQRHHFLSTDICGPITPTSSTSHRYLIVFVCLSYGVYFASTSRTQVVGTPTFIEDVDAYASHQFDSASVPALPVGPAELFYDKPAPFHDTVDPKVLFDVIGLGAWYSRDDHELVAMVQLQPASNSNDCRLPGPARASQPASQPGPTRARL
jgi:hypothetical protein